MTNIAWLRDAQTQVARCCTSWQLQWYLSWRSYVIEGLNTIWFKGHRLMTGDILSSVSTVLTVCMLKWNLYGKYKW